MVSDHSLPWTFVTDLENVLTSFKVGNFEKPEGGGVRRRDDDKEGEEEERV